MIPLLHFAAKAAYGAYKTVTETDPRLEPVRGDDIDERVNEQLARGRTDKL